MLIIKMKRIKLLYILVIIMNDGIYNIIKYKKKFPYNDKINDKIINDKIFINDIKEIILDENEEEIKKDTTLRNIILCIIVLFLILFFYKFKEKDHNLLKLEKIESLSKIYNPDMAKKEIFNEEIIQSHIQDCIINKEEEEKINTLMNQIKQKIEKDNELTCKWLMLRSENFMNEPEEDLYQKKENWFFKNNIESKINLGSGGLCDRILEENKVFYPVQMSEIFLESYFQIQKDKINQDIFIGAFYNYGTLVPYKIDHICEDKTCKKKDNQNICSHDFSKKKRQELVEMISDAINNQKKMIIIFGTSGTNTPTIISGHWYVYVIEFNHSEKNIKIFLMHSLRVTSCVDQNLGINETMNFFILQEYITFLKKIQQTSSSFAKDYNITNGGEWGLSLQSSSETCGFAAIKMAEDLCFKKDTTFLGNISELLTLGKGALQYNMIRAPLNWISTYKNEIQNIKYKIIKNEKKIIYDIFENNEDSWAVLSKNQNNIKVKDLMKYFKLYYSFTIEQEKEISTLVWKTYNIDMIKS
jgi:hypothetical protein